MQDNCWYEKIEREKDETVKNGKTRRKEEEKGEML